MTGFIGAYGKDAYAYMVQHKMVELRRVPWYMFNLRTKHNVVFGINYPEEETPRVAEPYAKRNAAMDEAGLKRRKTASDIKKGK